jgi:hypothetical protein
MAVLGYEPTPAELEMIRRGEDPRAGEDERRAEAAERREKEGAAGESREKGEPAYVEGAEPGPAEGTILRWLDSATVVIEANERRETVALAGQTTKPDSGDEYAALDERMNRWTFGTPVRLAYPVKDKQGRPIYRDERGNLLATIE